MESRTPEEIELRRARNIERPREYRGPPAKVPTPPWKPSLAGSNAERAERSRTPRVFESGVRHAGAGGPAKPKGPAWADMFDDQAEEPEDREPPTRPRRGRDPETGYPTSWARDVGRDHIADAAKGKGKGGGKDRSVGPKGKGDAPKGKHGGKGEAKGHKGHGHRHGDGR